MSTPDDRIYVRSSEPCCCQATRDMTWRAAEDQIRHYAPARYLCGLTETNWSPDHTTLHDFAMLAGEDGVALVERRS